MSFWLLAKGRRSFVIPLRTLSLQSRGPVEHHCNRRHTHVHRFTENKPLAIPGNAVLGLGRSHSDWRLEQDPRRSGLEFGCAFDRDGSQLSVQRQIEEFLA